MTEPTTEPAAQQPDAKAPLPVWKGLKMSGAWRTYTMVFALIAIWLIFAYTTGGVFLEARNFSNLMRQATITGVLAVGMLMVIVTGHIDLSIGSAVGLAGGVAAMPGSAGGWGPLSRLASRWDS